MFGNNIGVPLGNRPAYPGKRPRKADVPCYTQKIPNVNGPAAAKSAPSGAPATRAQVSPARQAAARGRPAGPCGAKLNPFGAKRQPAAGEAQVKTAIRKHLPDFLAILGLLVIAAAVVDRDPREAAARAAGWVP